MFYPKIFISLVLCKNLAMPKVLIKTAITVITEISIFIEIDDVFCISYWKLSSIIFFMIIITNGFDTKIIKVLLPIN